MQASWAWLAGVLHSLIVRPAALANGTAEPIRAELFGIERLEQHAESLAAAQRVGSHTGRSDRLGRRLRDNEAALRRAYTVTMASARDARSITPAADWLVDNFHVVQEQVSAIRTDLPPGFERQLPKLVNGPFAGFPRVYGLAWALVAHTDSCFDTLTLRRFLHAYQSVETLTIGELWAVAIALRVVLVENLRRLAEAMVEQQAARDDANAVADCLLGVGGQTSGARLERVKLPLPMAFAVQFVRRLRAEDPAVAAALRWLDASLLAQGTTAQRIVEAEQQRQGAANVTIRNVITSMRLMSSIDWRQLFESVSPVDAILVPASNFAALDFPTRELYRHAIEKLARLSPKSETEVTRLVLQQAASAARHAAPGGGAGKQADPGYYLIGKGRAAFEASIGCRLAWPQRLLRRAAARGVAFYIWAVVCLTALILAAALAFAGQAMPGWAVVALAWLGLLPASDAAMALVNGGAASRIRATALPGMALKGGVPEHLRTLVAIPVMLTSRQGIAAQVRLLEVLHLANNDGDLCFALIADFSDSPTQTQPDDTVFLTDAAAAVAVLNARHGPAPGGARFRLLHRRRLWNDGEEKWMGWERKRGKLHELNRLLRGATDTNFLPDPAGRPLVPGGVRFVIVLDADTRLPRGAAKRLIGKMAHPLNSPVMDSASGQVVDGYGLLQPRVTPALPSGTDGSLYQWAFGNTSGMDPYAGASSDLYQDLFGEGSFCGKGIYDVDAFEAALAGQIPENTLLSHDLLEGIFGRAGLASDIEVIDAFPARYDVAVSRQLRWVRGDWQLLPWIFGFWRTGGHRAISAVGRWKMIDNLRRSQSAPAAFVALVAGWCLPSADQWLWSAFIVITIATPALIPFLTSIFPRRFGLGKLMHLFAVFADFRLAAAQIVLLVAFLPYQAWANSVAILRTLFRLFVSRRHLLEWVTADQAQGCPRLTLFASYRRLKGGVVLAGAGAAMVFWARPAVWPVAAPFVLLWLASPAIAWWVSRAAPLGCAKPAEPAQIIALRLIARRTWRFFETFVTNADNMLPPDNFQEDPKPVIAHRTSPTNIGLYLLSVASAADFGWIGLLEAVERLEATFATMHRLARHRGHFFNWYDTQDLRPLEPEYISSVDSGNLAGHLIATWNFCLELAKRPVIPADWQAGIADPLALLEAALVGSPTSAEQLALAGVLQSATIALRSHTATPAGIASALAGLALHTAKIPPLVRALPTDSQAGTTAREEAVIWADALDAAVLGQLRCVTSVMPWAALLGADPACAQALPARAAFMPTLASLPALCGEAGRALAHAHRDAGGMPERPRLADAFRRSAHAATDLAARLSALETGARALLDAMKFDFLFDSERELLSIGYRVADGSLEPNFYDLLASEARLASFVAIAKGDLPTRHWFRLGRAMAAVGRGAALVSWSGSMFEYLMPSLVMRAPNGSLMERTNCEAVRQQRRYGALRGVPWGASESAYNARDVEFTYQYSSFGIPSLGLKHGLADSTVIAPYATALAAMVDPRAAAENFIALTDAGAGGRYGFYEALDYTASRVPEGARRVVVRAYMAHHQGMSIAAIANAVCCSDMHRRFHTEPMIEATELLLQERMPHDVVLTEPMIETAPSAASIDDPLLRTQRVFESPHAAAPRTHLLSNGGYAVMITAAGSGYSRWRGLSVNRWREDVTCDPWGSYIFVRDRQSGKIWSAGYQPSCVEPDFYHVDFSEGRAGFTRRDGDITTMMDIAVSSEDDAEVRRVSVTNHGSEPRELEITSYAELVLAAQAADIAHPVFSNMFVETSFLPEFAALLATRRRRDPAEAEIWAAHIAVVEGQALGEMQFETDRARFIGRGRSIRAALAMQRSQPMGNSQGCVLDPIFSLRRIVRVPAKSTARIAFWTFAADSRPAILSLLDRHHEPAAFERATTLAWTQAQVQLRHLGLDADAAAVFQRIADRLIYADSSLRAPADSIALGAAPVSVLWQHGISGDRPIVLVTVEQPSDLDLIRRLLLAHEYWGLKQLSVDLVILNEQTNSYAQDFEAEITALVNANRLPPVPALRSAKGAIHVLRAGLVSTEARALLEAASRAVFSGKRGSLAEQLASAVEPKSVAAQTWRQAALDSPRGMPKPRLQNWNGFGGFSEDGRDYVTILENGASTPAPWMNVICNPHFGFMVSAEGSGSTWSLDSQQNHLTPWSNDTVCDPPGEAMFMRDEETGDVWSPTALPIRLPGARYLCRHGQGFSRFEHVSHGIALDLVQFVPVDDPVKISRLTITNLSGANRRLSVTAYVQWLLGAAPPSAPLILTAIDAATGAMFARNPWNIDFGKRIAFADLSGRQTSFTGDRRAFLGRNGALRQPVALLKPGPLPNTVGAGLDPCAALQTLLHVPPNGTTEIVFLFGQSADDAGAQALIAKYRAADLDRVFAAVTRHWDDILGTVQVKTPDSTMDILLNRWLLYQTLACRIWARAGFYQASGAYGFRDQLQDSMALCVARPDIARAQLLRAAARQFAEGDVQHWWLPESGRGIRTRISDDRIWLAYVTAHYVTVTGDAAVLDEPISFLEGPILQDGQSEAFFAPAASSRQASLFDHCALALNQSLGSGAHGLPLIGSGDWNDGLNRVGQGGKGESIWLGWFLHATLTAFAKIADRRADTAQSNAWRGHAGALAKSLEHHGWDGRWYRRAYFDDGTPLGAAENRECRIDSIAQSWGVISGAADPARAAQAMAEVDKTLVRRDDALVLLFAPPFENPSHDPGYIAGYPPGIRENGGQYTHGAIWSVIAFAMLGDGDKAAGLFSLINPINHARTPQAALLYAVEPYVVAADVYGIAPHVGRGGWTWYTGSAGWMHRAGLEWILGFRVEAGELLIDPCIPKAWPGFDIVFRHRTATYNIRVDNPHGATRGIAHATLDGVALEGAQPRIKLDDDGKTHTVHIALGDGAAPVKDTK
jgi:cyclic beta-1,2-glucan synthetase